MKLLLKGHGVRIPFPETPGVKLRIVFFDTDEGRKQFRTNIIVLFGYRVAPDGVVIHHCNSNLMFEDHLYRRLSLGGS